MRNAGLEETQAGIKIARRNITVKGFVIVNKAEIDVFLELSCFFDDLADVGKFSLVRLPFLKPA